MINMWKIVSEPFLNADNGFTDCQAAIHTLRSCDQCDNWVEYEKGNDYEEC